MTCSDSDPILGPFKYVKGLLNTLMDRVVDLCNMVLMDAYRLPWPSAQSVIRTIARRVGDTCRLVKDFPRLSAYRLSGPEWTIVFVGGRESLQELVHLFFKGTVETQSVGRVALWKLSDQTQKWLAGSVDLVVCELSRAYHKVPHAPVSFSVPTWVHQVVTLPRPLESLISGKKRQNARTALNRARRTGFSFRHSRARTDFDLFHQCMYLPYVRARHGRRALVAHYQDQRRKWFAKRGVLLIEQDGKPVAGELCYVADDTLHFVERGVLGSSEQLRRQGIETIITWYTLRWAQDQGARLADMGATRAWCTNGSFNTKRRWGARVARRKKIYGTWVFLARSVPPSLRDYINRLGLICEQDGRLYLTALLDNAAAGPARWREATTKARECGLDGLAVIAPDSSTVVYGSTDP